MTDDKITVSVSPSVLVKVQRDDGGYHSGFCIMCGEGGWSNGPDCFSPSLGAIKLKKASPNQLVHKEDCVVATYLKGKAK